MYAFDGGKSRPRRGPPPKGEKNTSKNAKTSHTDISLGTSGRGASIWWV